MGEILKFPLVSLFSLKYKLYMFSSVIFWVFKGVSHNLRDLQLIQQEVCSLLGVLHFLDWTLWGFESLAGQLE